jgi:trk system potassium uptake protein TrkH
MVPAAFAAVIALGALLLALPVASEDGTWTDPVDALFTSTSAVCVTGLVRFDSADHWSVFGEVVIALLIQAGGLGVTIYAGALILLLGGRFGLASRQFFGMELMDVGEWNVRTLLRRVMWFTIVVEGGSFLLLLPWFAIHTTPAGTLWGAFFHALSSFNNAGFDLMGGNRGFTELVREPYPVAVMGVSAFLGSLSFITVFNLRVPRRQWSLDTRLVMIGMIAFLLIGIGVLLVGETGSGGILRGLSPLQALANAFFLSVNRTTGMSTVDLSLAADATSAALLVLMFIGGSSTSTAGGIKMGAFMVSLIVVVSTLRGRHRAEALGREIPTPIVQRAMTITIVGFVTHSLGTWALEVTDDTAFLPTLFEAMSAVANVGWSQNVTQGLSQAGALVLVALMFLGRLGPLLIALSLPDFASERLRYAQASVRIG